jgi:hypothetical protein
MFLLPAIAEYLSFDLPELHEPAFQYYHFTFMTLLTIRLSALFLSVDCSA